LTGISEKKWKINWMWSVSWLGFERQSQVLPLELTVSTSVCTRVYISSNYFIIWWRKAWGGGVVFSIASATNIFKACKRDSLNRKAQVATPDYRCYTRPLRSQTLVKAETR
jgi:hypothetical protein